MTWRHKYRRARGMFVTPGVKRGCSVVFIKTKRKREEGRGEREGGSGGKKCRFIRGGRREGGRGWTVSGMHRTVVATCSPLCIISLWSLTRWHSNKMPPFRLRMGRVSRRGTILPYIYLSFPLFFSLSLSFSLADIIPLALSIVSTHARAYLSGAVTRNELRCCSPGR